MIAKRSNRADQEIAHRQARTSDGPVPGKGVEGSATSESVGNQGDARQTATAPDNSVDSQSRKESARA